MKPAWISMSLFCFLLLIQTTSAEEIETFGKFGHVTIYSQSSTPSHVVLLVSGDGGWKLGVIGMAKNLATLDTLVVGIDISYYLKQIESGSEKCSYPAADFEALSKFIQKKRNYPKYVTPLLMGYSSGATLVYATLVQAPPGTFSGAFSLGFCPDLRLAKPLCRGYGLDWIFRPKAATYVFSPATSLKAPWVVFQGLSDKVCNFERTEDFVKKVPGAGIVLLPKVGHGYAVERNWYPEFQKAYAEFLDKSETKKTTASEEVKNLPLIEMRSKPNTNSVLAIIYSGDGGWASLDRQLGEHLSQNGMDVVGFNSLQYFWTPRTPEGASKDLERIIRHYSADWKKSDIILIGYSFGADVLPFLVDRLPLAIQDRVKCLVMLGPGSTADFEFHLADWIGGFSHNNSRPVLPEIEKLKGKKILCISGTEEKGDLCKQIGPNIAKSIEIGGGHHFGGNYAAIADDILKAMR